jgi:hypothetical protein
MSAVGQGLSSSPFSGRLNSCPQYPQFRAWQRWTVALTLSARFRLPHCTIVCGLVIQLPLPSARLRRDPYPGFLWMSALTDRNEFLSVVGWLNDWLDPARPLLTG